MDVAEEREELPSTAAPPAPGRHDGLIEIWFAEHFHGHSAMRDTETFNHLRRAVDELKRRLTEEHGQ